MTTKTTTKPAAAVSHAKPKAAAKKPTAKESAAKTVAKMKQAALTFPAPAPLAEIVRVPLDAIQANAQVRTEFNDETLKELAADIAANGMIQPILLRKNTGPNGIKPYVIVAGERRFRAAALALLLDVPAIVSEMNDDTATAVQIAENIQREDLSLADTAKAVRQLFDLNGGSATAVAERLHKSKSWVSKHLAVSCGSLEWTARKLLEDCATEDLEIILTVNKLSELDWRATQEIAEKIRAGTAGRSAVIEAYNKAKTERDERQQAAKAKDQTKAAKKKTDAEWEAEWKKKQAEEKEARRLDPRTNCYHLMGDLNEANPFKEIAKDAQDALENHLRQLHASGEGCNNATEFRTALFDMTYNNYHSIEMDAFTAGYLGVGFDLEKMVKLAQDATKEAD